MERERFNARCCGNVQANTVATFHMAGKNCPFLEWADPPMCPRVVDIILGLLRSRNQMAYLLDMTEEIADFKEHRANTQEMRANMEQ
ncbi:hypothetical protein Tco_1525612 [Tanacetum coccineum]